MNYLRNLIVKGLRFLLVWSVDTASLLITAAVLSGIDIQTVDGNSKLVVAASAALVLGIVNLLIRPIFLLLALPLGALVVFLAGFLLNAGVLMVTSNLMQPGFSVASWGAAFWGALFLSVVNTIITTLLALDDDDSFYDNLVRRLAVKRAGPIEYGEGQGLVIVEIDGLSYHHIQKAIEDGFMPGLQTWMAEQGYQLSKLDCGLPATTPACQAGILQGNNTNIPAFRWLDKKTNKLLAGGQAAAIIEPELSNGQGLLRGGSSIGNMFSGDADKSVLTFSKLRSGTPEDKKKRAQDIFLLMVNPYFFMRTLVLVFGDIFLEIWQGWRQRRKDVTPRLNRLHNGYPALRAATTVFLRDVTAYLTILDIVRGVPAIYMLYAGYDEVAHHSGPWTRDAMLTLRQFDRTIGRILNAIDTHAPRPYEFLMLSDHGQSFGPTFEQRFDISILDFIKLHLPQGTSAVATGGGDDGTLPVAAMMGELQNIQDNGMGGSISQAVVSTTQRTIQNNLDQQYSSKEVQPAKVTLCYSGNLAQVYFDLFPRRVKLSELNAAYPGMVDAIVQHEGIGFVVAYDDDDEPIAFGKQGARNLHSGDIVGVDPLLPYGDVELRSEQVRRIADFSNGGDIILNSTYYPDNTVAALEELIGSHGGLGGEQTDAFILHPEQMIIPRTTNSQDFMHLLDARRGLPPVVRQPVETGDSGVNAWSLSAWGKGLAMVKVWLKLAVGALTLQRDAYREIGRNVWMLAPALLISLGAQVLQVWQSPYQVHPVLQTVLRFGLFFISAFVVFISARVLRGKADYSATLRVAGFAQVANLLLLLNFLSVTGPLAQILATVLTFLGVWIGSSAAHEIRGWRSLILPLIYLITLTLGFVLIVTAIQGLQFTFAQILSDLGIVR